VAVAFDQQCQNAERLWAKVDPLTVSQQEFFSRDKPEIGEFEYFSVLPAGFHGE
jgi:hypothetical protein